MRAHVSLATADLEKSVAFYSVLLDALPTKQFQDYALFISDEPGLELALDLRRNVTPSADGHFGVFVDTAELVESAIARLERAGLVTQVERGETCCYANQSKVWATDPDGRRWEIYHVIHESDRPDGDGQCCAEDTCATHPECCAN